MLIVLYRGRGDVTPVMAFTWRSEVNRPESVLSSHLVEEESCFRHCTVSWGCCLTAKECWAYPCAIATLLLGFIHFLASNLVARLAL